ITSTPVPAGSNHSGSNNGVATLGKGGVLLAPSTVATTAAAVGQSASSTPMMVFGSHNVTPNTKPTVGPDGAITNNSVTMSNRGGPLNSDSTTAPLTSPPTVPILGGRSNSNPITAASGSNHTVGGPLMFAISRYPATAAAAAASAAAQKVSPTG